MKLGSMDTPVTRKIQNITKAESIVKTSLPNIN
jgi:hypothetical protein